MNRNLNRDFRYFDCYDCRASEGDGKDKGNQSERGRNGPPKACKRNECYCPKAYKKEIVSLAICGGVGDWSFADGMEIDRRYNQCLDEIRRIISTFLTATESDPQLLARFALQTISSIFRNLRQQITNQIHSTEEFLGSECTREKEKSFESSFIQKQWALQQLRRNNSQSWKPHRGLREKSVSVLRAWMFQNFLHPYPKDSEKHLLAIRSGLTRSQVSNWFINARVRLWKPMIEEMYSEINKNGQSEGTANDRRNHGSSSDQRLQTNRGL
ncbi:homeobox protein ATH1-like isoform X4 [Tasmannia lanceolata]|uniref:homeobox protein ATH1-like isoform X4 n=1 Tax=Tasmannia lanceolata TaxID=3420 RepID=UPI00406402C4